jgi:hypothetical protein
MVLSPFFNRTVDAVPEPPRAILRWHDYADMPDEELEKHDVAAYHLACTQGMRDEPTPAQKLECLDRLNHYAKCTDHYTRRELHRYYKDPERYCHSEGRFRMVRMVAMLQEQFGVRYNPAKIPEDAPLHAADSFIHGALIGDGGTCASLPVVCIAVGRRLGYPLKLVSTHRHLFCRWESLMETFNIEVNAAGLQVHSDEHYRTGRYQCPESELATKSLHLKSRTPREELGSFMEQRGHCFVDLKNWKEAVNSFIWASMLCETDYLTALKVTSTINIWRKEVFKRLPPNCPNIEVKLPLARRWPTLPQRIESDAILLETYEALLGDDDFQNRVVKPLCASPNHRPQGIPSTITVTAVN